MKTGNIKRQVSSGGVIFRKRDGRIEIALIAVKHGSVWCLPKGDIDKDEKPESTAVREVEEETGLKGEVVEKIGDITYWFYLKEEKAKCKKTVHFYLLEYESGDVSGHDFEVDEASWFPLDEALKKATHKSEKEIIEKAKEILLKLDK